MMKKDGINWIENSSEREMITGVRFETVKAGVNFFHKAVGRIWVHENDRVLVAKETLKQLVSDLVRAEDVNVANL